MTASSPLLSLHQSLDERRRPEEVAVLVQTVLADRLGRRERRTLKKATRHSLRNTWEWSSMSQTFARPVGMAVQLATAAELFPAVPLEVQALAEDPKGAESYISQASQVIGKTPGHNDFKEDRLDRAGRASAGLGDLSKRQYNKRFRFLARLEKKRERVIREWRKRAITQVSKSRLASRIEWEPFKQDRNTACFVAYYAARCNLRSVFSGSGQASPYDEVSDVLFQRCRSNPGEADWWVIAHVHPTAEALAQLSDERKGELLGMWFSIIEEIADFLHEVWNASEIDHKTMIVQRGNDSSTWNMMAGAWNRARDGWINTLYAMGLEEMLDRVCFGKVLRLMAADVAAWHRSLGKGLDPDTAVWDALPFPWEVLRGKATCTRGLIEAVCRQRGVDPEKRGWTAPRPTGHVEPFTPTPELVHGVSVASPRLASALKRAGWFSGKSGARTPTDIGKALVFCDEQGFAVHVEDERTLREKGLEVEDNAQE